MVIFVLLSIANAYPCNSPQEVFHPCKCSKWPRDGFQQLTLICDGSSIPNLRKHFELLSKALPRSESRFENLHLNNVTKLEANSFGNLTIRNIEIEKSPEFASIHPNAFGATSEKVAKLSILNANKLNGTKEVFEAIRTLTNLKTLYLRVSNINTIPTGAFSRKQYLKSILISGNSESPQSANTILQNNAFSNVRRMQLEDLSLTGLKINYIPEFAFALNASTGSINTLVISLVGNELNGTSFHPRALLHTDDKVRLMLDRNHGITYLDEKVFRPFLDKRYTYIAVNHCHFKCDCKMYWLWKGRSEKNYLRRVTNPACTDLGGRSLWYLPESHFRNCTTFYDN